MNRLYREYLMKYAFAAIMMCRGQLLGCYHESTYYMERCEVYKNILKDIEQWL